MKKTIAFLFCLLPSIALAQTQQQPVVVTSVTGTGANVTQPVGNGAGTSVPMPVTTSGCTPVSSTALAANLVVKASAGGLCSFNVSADSTLSGAAWWVMVYNAASAPADGAVTPLKCYALPTGATGISASFSQPASASAGIVIGVSTTGCFTKTASTHAYISGDYQ